MNKLIITLAVALFAVSAHAQQELPIKGTIEIGTYNATDDHCSLYKVTDADSHPGFYLNVARIISSLTVGIEDFNFAFHDVDEVSLFIGETYEEAMETLDLLIGMFGEADGTQREFKCYGGETATCTLRKGWLGKHLEFTFPQEYNVGESEVSKQALKTMRSDLKVAKKFNKKLI